MIVNGRLEEFADRHFRWLLAGILLFCVVSKVAHLGRPRDFYFDEVYHAYTAIHYAHGDDKAYDPWAKHPDNVAYEWTHPPLAKLIMAGYIRVMGDGAISWRLASVTFGTGAVALTALLGWLITGSSAAALVAALFMTLDGMVFVQSRIGMNDIYFVCFMLASACCYLSWKKRPSALGLFYGAGALLGLALGSKWTTLYFFPILTIDAGVWLLKGARLPEKNWVAHAAIAFGVLPVALYFLSYAQYFLMGYDMSQFIELQKQMWIYHTHLKATHPYASKPFQWIFDMRPVWMHVEYYSNDKIGNIYNLGNPILLWAGLYAALKAPFLLAERWDGRRFFALEAYLLFWLPWILSPRIMYFYHYLPALPFLFILLAAELVERPRTPARGMLLLISSCLMIVAALMGVIHGRSYFFLIFPTGLMTLLALADFLRPAESTRNDALFNVIVAAAAWFVLFYPNMTAMPVSTWFADAVYRPFSFWR